MNLIDSRFLTEYVNPLFEQVLEAQLALGIETYYETSPRHRKHSVNYFATNLFDEDLLNPFFYTRMPEQKYQPEVVNLGRTLFFDPVLSVNNERSCASCHQPDKGFTDGLAKSVALNAAGTVDRNAPTLLNAVYADRYFYDLRSEVLEDQMDHVVADHREFFTTYLDIFEKINRSEAYRAEFQRAFPEVKTNPVNKYTLSTALSAYVVSLKSFNSPFDRYVRGESAELSASARRGFNLFMGKAPAAPVTSRRCSMAVCRPCFMSQNPKCWAFRPPPIRCVLPWITTPDERTACLRKRWIFTCIRSKLPPCAMPP